MPGSTYVGREGFGLVGRSEGATVEITAKDGNVTIKIPSSASDASVDALAQRIREALVTDED